MQQKQEQYLAENRQMDEVVRGCIPSSSKEVSSKWIFTSLQELDEYPRRHKRKYGICDDRLQ
jgi:hypothetical protein